MIVAYNAKTQGDTKLSRNFTVKEFKDSSNDVVFIDTELVAALQQLRDVIGAPVNITSGFRTTGTNTRAGGSADSKHLYGQAADFYVTGYTAEATGKALEKLHPKDACIGVYYQTGHVHFQPQDTRSRYVVRTKGGAMVKVENF